MFISIKISRSHFSQLIDPNRKSLSRAQGFYIPINYTLR